MPQPYALSFGPWVPDGADIAIAMPFQFTPSTIPLSDCLNVYWSDQGYRGLKAFSGSGSALPAQCLRAIIAVGAGGTYAYAGTGTDLYVWNGAGYTNASKSSGAYAGTTFWSMVQFGACLCAANGLNVLQDLTLGGANFADVTGAPIGQILGVIGQFLMVGDITSPTAYPWRVQWSGIADPTSWPTPLTNAAIAVQSSYEDLTQEFGHVMFIAGGPQVGVIFQQLGITRATYQGGDVVFDFQPIDRKRGLVARGAAVQVADTTHFLAADGFYAAPQDGAGIVPTGSATDGGLGLDRWFWNNVNRAALGTISAAYDATLRCVVFAVPTGSNTLPDTLLILNPTDGRWTRAQVSNELVWSNLQTAGPGFQHILGLFSQTHQQGSLVGAPLSGYTETYDGSFLDGRVRDVIEGQLNGIVTDTPSMTIGTRQSLEDSIAYSAANTPDSFSRRVTWDPPPAGRLLRVRATSTAATALNGATIFTEMGGNA